MQDYFNYLNQVLGIKNILMPTAQEALSLEATSAHVEGDQVLSLSKPAFFRTAEKELHEGQDLLRCDLAIVNWVQHDHESLLHQPVAELFGKMLAAMKLKPGQVLVTDCVMNERNLIANELFKVCEARWVLFFCEEPHLRGQTQLKGSANWIETLSPAFLIKEPGAKKLVWSDMQKIMKEIT